MSKLLWPLIITVTILVAAGGTYYIVQQWAEPPISTPPITVDPPSESKAASRDEDLRRKKLEGIGNTRDLKPVPIPLGNAK